MARDIRSGAHQPLALVGRQRLQDFSDERRCSRRGNGNATSQASHRLDQLVKIVPRQQIASRQNQLRKRIAKFKDLAQEGLAFLECQLIWVSRRDRLGAAMPARQRAGLRHFPINVHRRLRVIAQFVVRNGCDAQSFAKLGPSRSTSSDRRDPGRLAPCRWLS